jgi:hypothetical protein
MQDDNTPLKSVNSYQPGRDDNPSTPSPKPAPAKSKKKRWPPAFWSRWSKRRKIIVSLAVLLILIGIGFASAALMGNDNPIPNNKTVAKKQVSTTVASPLTGVQVAPDLAKRPVTGIMIENSTDARPQSGIQDAGVVFEAIAEGGITRFLTLYQEAQPSYIGPVRSLRPYYLWWSYPFDASIAHVGGSPDALAEIRNGGKDLDQFFNSGAYERIGARAAPHNVYTSFEKMDALNASKGYTTSKVQSWARKKEAKIATPTAKSIDMAISGPTFNVHYDYDAGTNSYIRSEGGAPHMAQTSPDVSSAAAIHPKVAIAMVIPYSIAADGQHSQYDVTGSGAVFIFQDGGVTQGTWTKSGNDSQITFTDSQGKTIALDPGQTWVTMVQSAPTYAP